VSGSGPQGPGSDPGPSSMGPVGSRSVRVGLATSGSGSGPLWLGSSVSGLAPAKVRSVWNCRSIRLGDVVSGSGPQGPGSDPGPSSVGPVGSRSVRVGLATSGSGSGPLWLGSSVSGLAPAKVRSAGVWNCRSVRLGDVVSGSGPQGPGSDPGPSSVGPVGSSSVRVGLATSGSGSGPLWLDSSVSSPAPAKVSSMWS
jgi:hypothetical protein